MLTPPEQRMFFMTGRIQGDGLDAIGGLELRPAALANYRDLRRLRYDFPVVLVSDGAWAGTVHSLSSVVDRLLANVAPRGLEGERLRRHVLRLEREIRTLCAVERHAALSELWTQAAENVGGEDASARDVLMHVAGKLDLDGAVVDCDAAIASRICEHLWQAAQEKKAAAFRTTVGRLIVRLSDILRAAFIRSDAGRQPEALRAALGGAHRDAFDFNAMSKLVARNARKDELPPARRARMEHVLEILKAQRFYADAGLAGARRGDLFGFRFDDCQAAADAFRARLPALCDVVKAIAIAELEVEGRYVDARHDPFFEHFDVGTLSADDLAMFPDYFVRIEPSQNDAPENAGLMEMLSAGLPVKVLVEAPDLIEDAAPGIGHFAFGVRSIRLANTATGLGGVFVVQATTSHLYSLRTRVEAAFAHRGAALISVYAGVSSHALPPYLCAAAAMESRAFPAFAYDPYAGDNQAARFSLADNPQPEADWPVATLEYGDENLQRVREETAFTIADFVLCDPRYSAHFARVPRERWNPSLVPADEWLASSAAKQGETVPCVLAVDAHDALQRVLVDGRLMNIVARGRTFWHRLQEQGGIHNSHAEILLAREKARWAEERALEEQSAKPSSALPEVTATPASAASGAAAPAQDAHAASTVAVDARNTDEAWIETSRCPSCNECQTINDRMFRYNDNKQAYIADISAGTYRQLVEAAEACQVAIIHPGKPRDPNEPGIEELLERAKPFL